MITYKEQFDKVTTAYIKGLIEPYDAITCFVGTLLNKDIDWKAATSEGYNFTKEGFTPRRLLGTYQVEGIYTNRDVAEMEGTFLYTVWKETNGKCRTSPHYNDAIFSAMQKSLEVLKDIHIRNGENVDTQEIPQFNKRVLL